MKLIISAIAVILLLLVITAAAFLGGFGCFVKDYLEDLMIDPDDLIPFS